VPAQDRNVLRREAKAREQLIIDILEPRPHAVLCRIILNLNESTHEAGSGLLQRGRTRGHASFAHREFPQLDAGLWICPSCFRANVAKYRCVTISEGGSPVGFEALGLGFHGYASQERSAK
jgi:hypothetical protein